MSTFTLACFYAILALVTYPKLNLIFIDSHLILHNNFVPRELNIINKKDRLKLIKSELLKRHSLSLHDIMRLTGASRDTTRRDILTLVEQNDAERVYGGINQPHSFSSRLEDLSNRSVEMTPVKDKMGRLAAQMIGPDEIVYFDVSSTISFIPRHLDNSQSLLAITNSLEVAEQLLSKSKAKVRMLGGTLNREMRYTTGTKPLIDIGSYHFDVAFISSIGMTERGMYYAFDDEIDFKKAIIEHSDKVVLLVDSTKVNKMHNFLALNFNDIDIIVTNKPLPDKIVNVANQNNVEIFYTNNDGGDWLWLKH